jgi:hypothetical protein
MARIWIPLPPFEELNEYYEYKPDTGELILKKRRCCRDTSYIGKPVGNLRKRGKRWAWTITHKGRNLYVSRIVWMLMTKEDPKDLIVEHKNRNPADNRWSNLRLATAPQNGWNQVSTGYSKRKDSGKYRARITVANQRFHLGNFNTPQDARKAVEEARIKYHKEFACIDLE